MDINNDFSIETLKYYQINIVFIKNIPMFVLLV